MGEKRQATRRGRLVAHEEWFTANGDEQVSTPKSVTCIDQTGTSRAKKLLTLLRENQGLDRKGILGCGTLKGLESSKREKDVRARFFRTREVWSQ